MSIEVRHITKTYGSFTALHDVSLRVNDGELVALLGPSGSGKTTLLRVIAGLEAPDPHPHSEILFADTNVTGCPVGKRRVGFVFQHYALFRHLSVFENIAFGLRVRPRKERPNRGEIQDRVDRLLQLIQLDGLGHRYPGQLSGGQRQRVALARALAVEPQVLLLDEPFGALDAKVRQGLRDWLRRLHDEIHLTSVLVTHDQEEALEVADRVVLMNNAKIEQIGTPDEVFHQPANQFVMEFLGQVNMFHARIGNGQAIVDDLAIDLPQPTPAHHSSATVYMRPHELGIRRTPANARGWEAKVLRVNPAGSTVKITLARPDGSLVRVDLRLEDFQESRLTPGETVFIHPKHIRVFLPDTAGNLLAPQEPETTPQVPNSDPEHRG